MKKNTINISIDIPAEKENIINIPLCINIHTIVNGKVSEQLNIDLNLTEPMPFGDLWKKIGERIEQHMRENKNYNHFGS